MKIKKISSRKRIKIKWDIAEALGYNYYEQFRTRMTLLDEFGLSFTSRRYSGYSYYKVVDQMKYMLFIIKFGNFIKK